MKKLLIIITLSILALDAFAQRRVSGTVFYDNGPAISVTIEELNVPRHINAVLTDFDGWFELITTKDTTEITTSWIGAIPQTIKITSDTIVTIRLENCSTILIDHPRTFRTR